MIQLNYPRPLPPRPPREPLLLELPPRELLTEPELRDGADLRTELDREDRLTELLGLVDLLTELLGLVDLLTELLGLVDLLTELLGRVFRTEDLLFLFTLLRALVFRTELLFPNLLLLLVARADLRPTSDRE